jgi:LacI family transcriptional regulator
MGEPKRSNGANPPRVLLAMRSGGAFCLGVTRGLADYIQQRGPWTLLGYDGAVTGEALRHYAPVDGVISLACSPSAWRSLRRGGIPAVFVEASPPGRPQVLPDDRGIGRLAAEHLRDIGMRELACVTHMDVPYARKRWEGFAETAASAGIPARLAVIPSPGRGLMDRRALRQVLGSLSRPAGLLAVQSSLATASLGELPQMGLSVPDDVAIVASRMEALSARLHEPSITSLDIATSRIGYLAGEWLGRMMAGGQGPVEPVRVAPTRVIERASTDVLAIEDPALREALVFIRRRAGEGIGVPDVLHHVPISRRALELRFRRRLGRSIHKEIVRVRLDLAKRLLAETDLPLPDIAVRVGYEHASNLCGVFRRELSATPSEFRSRRSRSFPVDASEVEGQDPSGDVI